MLARKANHPLLHDDVAQLFETLAEDVNKQAHYTFAHDYTKTVDMGHDRIEVRQIWTIDDPTLIANLRTAQQWPHLDTLIRVQAERYLDGRTSVHIRYYLSSLRATAAERLAKVRAHWSIENSLHWVLDIAFREDESRLRKDFGATNFVILCHITLNLLKQEHSLKLGIKNKRLTRVGITTIF